MSSTRPTEPQEELRHLLPGDEDRLAAFFEQIAGDRFFHPHPFDRATAERICREPNEDDHVAYFFGGHIIAYGLLRGWEPVPSLGIIVHPSYRGKGRARTLMAFLHGLCVRSTHEIRLRVHPDNQAARWLYHRLGYQFDGRIERGELVGVYTFPVYTLPKASS